MIEINAKNQNFGSSAELNIFESFQDIFVSGYELHMKALELPRKAPSNFERIS